MPRMGSPDGGSRELLGIKWVVGFPENARRDLPAISATTILSARAWSFALAPTTAAVRMNVSEIRPRLSPVKAPHTAAAAVMTGETPIAGANATNGSPTAAIVVNELPIA